MYLSREKNIQILKKEIKKKKNIWKKNKKIVAYIC